MWRGMTDGERIAWTRETKRENSGLREPLVASEPRIETRKSRGVAISCRNWTLRERTVELTLRKVI